MKEFTCRCQACDQPFKPDARASGQQRFCSREECQRTRRTQNQRRRRRSAANLKPSEAAWSMENPLFVGYISQLIGSINRNEIESKRLVSVRDLRHLNEIGRDFPDAELYCFSEDPSPKQIGRIRCVPWALGIDELQW